MQNFALSVSVFGSIVALTALAVENMGRYAGAPVQARLARIGRSVQFRLGNTEIENLTQMLILLGAAILLVGAGLNSSPVYVGLQGLLVVSALFWYIDVAKNPERSESIKGTIRLTLAIGVAILLYTLGYCQGFALVGVAGLELLGCGFVLNNGRTRDVFLFTGALVLAIYGIAGLVIDQGNWASHIVWGPLNVVYALLAGALLVASVRARASRSKQKL